MKKYLSVLAAVVLLFSCGKETSDPSGDNQPQGGGGDKPTDELTVTCTTGQATEIDPTSAKLSGTATIANAKEANGKACFYYSATQGDAQALKSASKADADNVAATGGSFTVTISGLSPETTYYYVAAVTIDSKETFGELKSFTTAELPKGPTTTGSATNVTEWSAVLSAYANPTTDMGTVTMGIIYSTDENPTLENGVQLTSKELDGNNMYTVKATQLASNTTYYYKSTLESAGVIRSGEVKSFKTKEIDISVTTGEATEVGKKEATISGEFLLNTSEDLDKEVGFLVSTSVNTANGLIETGTKYIVKDPSEGIFSYHFSYLNYETTYYYMAYASVHDKIVYGDIKEFKTLDLIELSVLEEENITLTTATLYATFNREELSSLVGSYSLEWGGFIYSDTVDTLEELIESGEVETGWLWGNEFGITLHDLKTNTKYYYVAALTLTVNNREYKYYTDVHSFETLPIPATSISLDRSSLELHPGETFALVANVLPENTTDHLTWESFDTTVATVVDGEVTAVSVGETTITVRVRDLIVECKVVVSALEGNQIDVRYYSCVDDYTHVDIHLYSINQIAPANGYSKTLLKQNWTSATAVISGTYYDLPATDGASLIDNTQHSNYHWIWAFQNSTVRTALINAATTPVTIIMKDVLGGEYTLSFNSNQSSTEVFYAYGVNTDAVDLGLSVKWAPFNLGGSKPEDYGDYYAWGETDTKEEYSWSTYKWCNGSYSSLTKYNTQSVDGIVDNKTVLDPEDDVAHIKLGGQWRMPTYEEWAELLAECTWEWTNQNGVNGRKVTGPNGNSIFLPAAGGWSYSSLSKAGSNGLYWSSSLCLNVPYRACFVDFNSDEVINKYGYGGRYTGYSIRPVKD